MGIAQKFILHPHVVAHEKPLPGLEVTKQEVSLSRLYQPKANNEFGVELPEELGSRLSEMTLSEQDLANGNRLSDMHFPEGTLVMMVKRGNSFIVPNGQLGLQKGDILLTIARQESEIEL